MGTETTTSFEVSHVEKATKPLAEVPYKQAVEALLTPRNSDHDRHRQQALENLLSSGGLAEHVRTLLEEQRDRLSIAISAATPSRPVEACTRYHGRLVADVAYHPVVAAIHRAFRDHRPLTLSPDTIWLMITQGVAHHVNAHAEQLRPRLVRHQGRHQLDVRRDDFVKGSPENPWPEVFAEFSTQVREHIGPTHDLFLPSFSTTGPVERAASEIVLLDAVQSYFSYTFHTLCGIPSITLEGTTDDWQSLTERAGSFAEFGLEPWIDALGPILRQFVRASQGDVETGFWRSIYKLNNQSGGPMITGWITAFFPYLKRWDTGQATVRHDRLFEGGARGREQMLYPGAGDRRAFAHGPTMDCLPGGLAQAPFLWDYQKGSGKEGRTYEMEFLGGFVGVVQDPATLGLRPEIGWAVREAAGAA